MKKLLMLIFLVMLAFSLTFMGISCKEEAVEEEAVAVEEEVVEEEAVEEAEEAVAVEEEVVDGGVLHMGFSRTPININICGTIGSLTYRVFRYTFDTLIRHRDSGEIEPGLAETWEISPDGLEYIFHLRKDVLWQDGEPFNADDVVFTFNYSLNPVVGSTEVGAFWDSLKGFKEYWAGEADSISGVTKIDDYTVKVVLNEVNVLFLANLSHTIGCYQMEIMPEHVVSKIAPEDWKTSDFATVRPYPGTGPYIFENYETGQYIKLTRNPLYWDDVPNIETIYMDFFSDPSTMAIALEKGEIDIGDLVPSVDLEYLESLPNLKVTKFPQVVYYELIFNCGPKGTIPLLVRQAIAYSIDTKTLVDKVMEGAAFAEYRHMNCFEWANSPNLNPYDYDPEKAKALLEEADWDMDYEIEMLTSDEATAPPIVAIQKWMMDIGLKVKITQIDAPTSLENLAKGVDADYDMTWSGGHGGGLDPSTVVACYLSDAIYPDGWNSSVYQNPEFDRLYYEGKSLIKEEDRQPIYWKISEILNYDLPLLPLYKPELNYVINDRVKNHTWSFMRWDDINDWYVVD